MNNYKISAPLVLVMGLLMFLLNYCTTIAACAFVYTLLMLTVNVIFKTFGFKRALQTVSAYVGINLLFLSGYDYSIRGQVFEYLVPTSLLAVLLASVIFMKTVSLLENRIGILKSTFVGLVSAAIIDGIIMLVYFTNYVSASKFTSIFLKETSFKCLYALAILAAIKGIQSVLGKNKLQSFDFKLKN